MSLESLYLVLMKDGLIVKMFLRYEGQNRLFPIGKAKSAHHKSMRYRVIK
jgi:hypothetical protein